MRYDGASLLTLDPPRDNLRRTPPLYLNEYVLSERGIVQFDMRAAFLPPSPRYQSRVVGQVDAASRYVGGLAAKFSRDCTDMHLELPSALPHGELL